MAEQTDRQTVTTRTPVPPVGPAGSSATRVDEVASGIATMAAEAQQAALSYRSDMQAAMLRQIAAEAPVRARQGQGGGS